MQKCMYDLDLRKVKKNYDYGDLSMLEYLKDFIPEKSNLNELYIQVLEYNEIFANNWTINDLFKMGKEDKYWEERAKNFIKKYNVKESEYNEFSDFFDKYTELRNELLDELGIDTNIFEEDLNKISKKGIVESDTICNVSDLNTKQSFTVARVNNFCHSVELHYDSGLATVEYGTKIEPDYWESVVEGASWFNRKMSNQKVLDKLEELFKKEFGEEEFYARGDEDEICLMS